MTVNGVKCDELGCGWRDEGERRRLHWLGKPCPGCHKGKIITVTDLCLLVAFRLFELASRAYARVTGAKLVHVSIDVGPMRRGEPPTITEITEKES